MPRFQDIPKFPRAHFEVTVGWTYLEIQLNEFDSNGQLDLDPDFQREHVWTKEQQESYVEYILMGGEVARNIIFNCATWPRSITEPITLIDGKQRLEAVRAFMRNELPAFGAMYDDYEDRPDTLSVARFSFRICGLESREDILNLYLSINAGGTPHTQKELNRVRLMLNGELE